MYLLSSYQLSKTSQIRRRAFSITQLIIIANNRSSICNINSNAKTTENIFILFFKYLYLSGLLTNTTNQSTLFLMVLFRRTHFIISISTNHGNKSNIVLQQKHPLKMDHTKRKIHNTFFVQILTKRQNLIRRGKQVHRDSSLISCVLFD